MTSAGNRALINDLRMNLVFQMMNLAGSQKHH